MHAHKENSVSLFLYHCPSNLGQRQSYADKCYWVFCSINYLKQLPTNYIIGCISVQEDWIGLIEKVHRRATAPLMASKASKVSLDHLTLLVLE
jgi:hypothetical protein